MPRGRVIDRCAPLAALNPMAAPAMLLALSFACPSQPWPCRCPSGPSCGTGTSGGQAVVGPEACRQGSVAQGQGHAPQGGPGPAEATNLGHQGRLRSGQHPGMAQRPQGLQGPGGGDGGQLAGGRAQAGRGRVTPDVDRVLQGPLAPSSSSTRPAAVQQPSCSPATPLGMHAFLPGSSTPHACPKGRPRDPHMPHQPTSVPYTNALPPAPAIAACARLPPVRNGTTLATKPDRDARSPRRRPWSRWQVSQACNGLAAGVKPYNLISVPNHKGWG
jgi:hypothetical protein